MKNIKKIFSLPKKNNYLIYFLILLVLLGIAYFIYSCFNTKSLNNKTNKDENVENFSSELSNEVQSFNSSSVSENEIVIIKYYAPWCGYCKKLKPEWNKLIQNYNNKKINNKNIKVLSLDCDKYEKEASKHKIPGYPTIRIYSQNSQKDYEGTRDFASISKFIEEFVN